MMQIIKRKDMKLSHKHQWLCIIFYLNSLNGKKFVRNYCGFGNIVALLY